MLKGEFSVANRSLWTTAIETETKEISPMVLATIPMVVVVHGESHISKSQSNSVAVGSINIGGNVSGNIIIGSNNQVSQVSESNDNEKVYSEKFERERVEKIALEKAEREASEKVAKEKAYREAAEKAAKEKAEREVAEKAAREIVGQLDARKARIEFEDKMMDVKGYKNSRQTRKQPRRKLKAQIVVALIGAVATVIAGVLSSPLLSKLITNNVTPTSMFIVTKTPKSTNTVIPTVTLTKTPPPTRTKVLTPTSTLTPTNVPQSSILYQEDFEDNQISREWSTVWDIKADESGNHFWVATGTYHAYPNAWFYNLSEDWKNYALETRVKIMNGGVFLNVRNGGVGSLGRYTAWISENDDWVSMAQYTYSPSSFDEIPGAGKNYKFERNTWYLLRVEITDTNLSFFVDNKLVSEVSLPKPIVSTYGSIGFYVTKGDNVYLDNIRVWKLP